MAWANEVIGMMQQEHLTRLQVGQMTGPTSCKIGNLILAPEDLLFSDRLLHPTCTKVSEVSRAEGSACTDKSTYLSALKSGDQVLVYQISDSKFIVIERLVSA